jgi:hypothetical protein
MNSPPAAIPVRWWQADDHSLIDNQNE